MAGLLDFIVGDDQVKDTEGLTEADRRMPYWAAATNTLGKVGGLLMAAGQPLHPEQRAQYLGQVGSALGGFGGDVMAAKSDMAKQRLAQQTVQSNRTKLANQAKMAAYAQSAEGQQALSGLKPHEQFAAKVALDGGDADAFARIMSNVGTAEHRNRMAEVAEARARLAQERADHATSGGLRGTGTEPQMRNRLQEAVKKWRETGDVSVFSTPEYIEAHDYITKPKTMRGPNDELVQAPGQELSWAPPPFHDKPYVAGPGGAFAPAPVTLTPGAPQKALDKNEMGEVSTALGTLHAFDSVRQELDKHPDIKIGNTAAGWVTGAIPGGSQALNALDPSGVKARAMIANIGSMIIKDRSGAAVALHEMSRLAPFIPDPHKDTPEQIRTKLAALQELIDGEMRLYLDNLKAANKAIPPDLAKRYGGGGAAPATKPKKYNPQTDAFE